MSSVNNINNYVSSNVQPVTQANATEPVKQQSRGANYLWSELSHLESTADRIKADAGNIEALKKDEIYLNDAIRPLVGTNINLLVKDFQDVLSGEMGPISPSEKTWVSQTLSNFNGDDSGKLATDFIGKYNALYSAVDYAITMGDSSAIADAADAFAKPFKDAANGLTPLPTNS